ncbi:MAG: TetR/AcrR family transcriptional regulator [Solirubrobacteraceae bacterium]|nr:TetR/AcrR family transcriptional regulator [Solirubrobacteraceae bacterium]
MSIGSRTARGSLSFEAILDAAEKEFLAHGFDRTRVDDIARAAHVGVGTVYLHFENKDGVYGAVILRGQDIMLNQYLLPILRLDLPPWQRIERWCRAYMRFFEEHEPRARMMASLAYGEHTSRAPAAIHDALRENITRFNDEFVAVFKEAEEAGQLSGADPLAASRFVWSAVYGICMTNARHTFLQFDSERLRGVLDAGMLLMGAGDPGSKRLLHEPA